MNNGPRDKEEVWTSFCTDSGFLKEKIEYSLKGCTRNYVSVSVCACCDIDVRVYFGFSRCK